MKNPTVFFLDRLPTLDCCCQRRRSDHSFHGLNAVSELRSRSRLPSPTRWNASSCIIECDHNFARLRIDHLDYLEYCSFFTIFASVSSYDAACSCSASFQLVTRLRNLRSVMRFFLSFPPAVGCALFLACCWLCSFLWLTSTIHLRPAPAPGPFTSKSPPHHAAGSRLKLTVFCFLSLSMDTNRHSRPSPSCHNHQQVTCGRLDRRTSPCNPSLPRLPWYPKTIWFCTLATRNRSELAIH